MIILGISFNSEKSSKEIQADINSRNNELRLIKEEIKEVESNIIEETKNAISTSELLEHWLKLTWCKKSMII